MSYRSPVEDAVLARLLAADPGPGDEQRYGEGPDHVWEWWGPEGAPVVVLVHGGYFRPAVDRTHARPMAAALSEAGYRVALAEYRRVPGDPDASVDDLVLLADHLGRNGEAPVAWVGHSAGGTLAMLLLLLGKTRGPVVALAPVADLARAATEGLGDEAVSAWMGGLPGEVAAYARLDPAVLLRRDGFPDAQLTVVHPAEDGTVPAVHTRDLGIPATLVPGASHFDVVDPESPHVKIVFAALQEAIARAG